MSQIKPNTEKTDCLIRCHGEHCSSSQCCSRENFLEDANKSVKDNINRKYDKKEITPAAINLEKFTIYEEETLEQTVSDPRAEKSAHNPTNENICSNDKQIESIVNINSEASSCAINLVDRIQSTTDTDRASITTDSNLDHSIVS